MGNAINNSGNQASNASQLSDMLSRMASGKQGDESGSESFARWMSQHQGAQAGNLASNQPSRPATLSTQVRPPVASALPNVGVARAQSARASTPLAAHEPERVASNQGARQEARFAKARADQAPKPASRQPAANQAKPADEAQDAARSDATSRAELIDDKAENATRFTTALGEGVAEVRELTPPTDVQANDSASMMAWLVSLTQTSAQALPADGSLDGDASGEGTLTEGESGLTLLGQDVDKGDQGRGRGRGLAQGWSVGQRELGLDSRAAASSSTAALQVDALLGRGAAAAEQAGDPLASMMAIEGGRASFGQALSQAAAPRHEQASIPVPLNAPDFSQKLADQVSLWVGQVKQDGPMTAELHLNPAEMGPINVKISLDGTAAQVDFAAAALETRQAIEASLSLLSSALSDAGLSLSGGGVSSQTPQQTLTQGGNTGQDGRGARSPNERTRGEEADAAEAGGLRQVSAPKASRLGGLDLYA